MPARSVCLVTVPLSEAGPGRFGRQQSFADLYHTIPHQATSLVHMVWHVTAPAPEEATHTA